MGMTEKQWAQLVLEDAGLPVTHTNINNVLQWMTAEEPTSNWFDRNNPLNSGLNSGPADGTGSYPNLTVGAHETAATIDGSYESGIRNALAHNDDRAQFDTALQAAPWASSHYPDIQGVQAPSGNTPAPASQVGSGKVDPVSGVKPTSAKEGKNPTNGTSPKDGTHPKGTTRHTKTTDTKDKKVQVVKTEMDVMSKLLKQGEADVSKITPLTHDALAALTDITSLVPTSGAGMTPTSGAGTASPKSGSGSAVLTELTSAANSLTTMVTDLQDLLAKISKGLKSDDELVDTTTKKTGTADAGAVPPGLSSILGPGLTKALSGPTGTSTKPKTGTTSGTKETQDEKKLVSAAHSFLGIPYKYGGDNRSGVDCSGLTQLIFEKALGKTIGRDTTAQLQSGKTVGTDGDWAKDVKLLKPGDLIFYGEPGASGPNAHVVIYIGDGKVIQAAHTGTNVEVSPLFSSAAADEPFLGVRSYT